MKNVVKCLVINEANEILLLKRAEHDSHSGYWETPGGGVDPEDATFEAACCREVQEEAGIQLSEMPILQKEMILPDSETGERFAISMFNANVKGVQADLSDNPDHDAFIWVSIESVLSGAFDVDSWTLEQLRHF